MNRQLLNLVQLILAIVVMSSSGTLGRYIELPPPVVIWARCLLAAVALYLFLKIWKYNLKFSSAKFYWIVLITSIFMGLHWVTYFYSLQLSNVAIGMLSLFTYPIMTAALEPVMLKIKFQYFNFFMAIIALVGVGFLVPELTLENEYTLGIIMGMLSALFYSLRNILLKKHMADYSGITIMFYQTMSVSILLVPVLFLYDINYAEAIAVNWPALLLLGLITTAIGHTLFVISFKNFTISTISIISALTPLVGIFLGYLFLDEVPANRTFIGGTLIFLTVVAESIRTVRQHNGKGS